MTWKITYEDQSTEDKETHVFLVHGRSNGLFGYNDFLIEVTDKFHKMFGHQDQGKWAWEYGVISQFYVYDRADAINIKLIL